MDYTNVLQALNTFCDRFRGTLEQESMIGTSPWQELLEELLGIKDLLNDPVISQPLDNYQIQPQSPVEKFGAASIVIALSEDGMNPKSISAHLETQGIPISEAEIKGWLKAYQQAPITQKPAMANGSIFDTQGQMQIVFDKLHTLLDELDDQEDSHYLSAKITKEQVKLDYMKEIRQSIKDAASLAAVVANMQTVEQFKKVVIEEVNKVDPATAQRIWKKIREAKAMYSSLQM